MILDKPAPDRKPHGDNDPASEHGKPADPGATRAQWIARGAFAATLLSLCVWLVWSFVPALTWAAIIAIATWPLFQRIRARCPAPLRPIALPAGFTLAIGLVFVAPLIGLGILLHGEARSVYELIENVRQNGWPVPDWLPQLPGLGPQLANWWRLNLERPEDAAALVKGLNPHDILAVGESFGGHLGAIAATFIVTLLTLFFLFKDGAPISQALQRLSERAFGPRGKLLSLQIVSSVHATVDGLVFVGIGEGVVLTVAYYLTGTPQALWLGVATAIGAIIPFGAFVMFSIASLMLVYKGATFAAILVFLLGLVVLTVADHVIRPIVIGSGTKLPFPLVLLGILGGVETFGLLGLFLGPAMMTVLVDLWREATSPAPASDAGTSPDR